MYHNYMHLNEIDFGLNDQEAMDFLSEINHPPCAILKECYGKWEYKEPPTKEQVKTELGLNQECPEKAGPPSVQAKPANKTTQPRQVTTVQATNHANHVQVTCPINHNITDKAEAGTILVHAVQAYVIHAHVTCQWLTFTATISDYAPWIFTDDPEPPHWEAACTPLPKPAPLMGPTKCNQESTAEMETKCCYIQQHQQLHHNTEGLEGLPILPFDLDVTPHNEPPGNWSYMHALLEGYQRSSASFTQKCIIEFWCHHGSSYDDVPLLPQTVLLAMESTKDLPGESNGPKIG